MNSFLTESALPSKTRRKLNLLPITGKRRPQKQKKRTSAKKSFSAHVRRQRKNAKLIISCLESEKQKAKARMTSFAQEPQRHRMELRQSLYRMLINMNP